MRCAAHAQARISAHTCTTTHTQQQGPGRRSKPDEACAQKHSPTKAATPPFGCSTCCSNSPTPPNLLRVLTTAEQTEPLPAAAPAAPPPPTTTTTHTQPCTKPLVLPARQVLWCISNATSCYNQHPNSILRQQPPCGAPHSAHQALTKQLIAAVPRQAANTHVLFQAAAAHAHASRRPRRQRIVLLSAAAAAGANTSPIMPPTTLSARWALQQPRCRPRAAPQCWACSQCTAGGARWSGLPASGA